MTNLFMLTQLEAATLLGVSTRTLRDWAKAGLGVPRNADATYNAPALAAWYCDHTRGSEFRDQRERLAAAQAEKVETENRVRLGELAEMSRVAEVWTDHISAARSRLLALPSKLPALLEGRGAPAMAALIRTEVNAALHELARDK
jgi:phage terminase Nu1 subunit (DNA packaging protein)